jgi:hypothetical protein
MTFEVVICLLAIAFIFATDFAYLVATAVVKISEWIYLLYKRISRSESEPHSDTLYRAESLHRLKIAITILLVVGTAVLANWLLAPKASEPKPVLLGEIEVPEPNSEQKSKWHLWFSARKSEDQKPTTDKAGQDKPKSGWKLELKKSDKAEEPAKQQSDDAK